MRLAVAALAVALLAAPAAARLPPATRYHFTITSVVAVDNAPSEISLKAKLLLAEILAGRSEFVATLEGAPDPKTDPAAFTKYVDAHHIQAYTVTLKIDRYHRDLVANDKPGKSGQVLTIGLDLSLVGTKLPGGLLALAGSGGATVAAEVGSRMRPREEEVTMDDALRAALTQAVDGAVAELRRPPPKAAAKPKPKPKP